MRKNVGERLLLEHSSRNAQGTSVRPHMRQGTENTNPATPTIGVGIISTNGIPLWSRYSYTIRSPKPYSNYSGPYPMRGPAFDREKNPRYAWAKVVSSDQYLFDSSLTLNARTPALGNKPCTATKNLKLKTYRSHPASLWGSYEKLERCRL